MATTIKEIPRLKLIHMMEETELPCIVFNQVVGCDSQDDWDTVWNHIFWMEEDEAALAIKRLELIEHALVTFLNSATGMHTMLRWMNVLDDNDRLSSKLSTSTMEELDDMFMLKPDEDEMITTIIDK